MKYDLTRPCPECPFRSDIRPYLRAERVEEILEGIIDLQGTFSCHKTNVAADEDEDGGMVETTDTQHCAGALILLEKMWHPNQMMRIAERLGIYDPTRLHMDAPVYDEPDDMIAAAEHG